MFFDSYKSILFSDTQVSDLFITEYMPSMEHDMVRIYLYCLFLSKHGKKSGEQELSSKLGIDVQKVKEAFTYFENVGLAEFKEGRVVMTDLKEKEINKLYRMKLTSTPGEAVQSSERNKKRSRMITDINNTFFQGVMAPSWYTDIDAWFDKYHFDEDVMYALFNHCKNSKGLMKNYVAVVAESWYSKGIRNFFDLDNYSEMYGRFKDIRAKISKKLKRKSPFTEYEEMYIEKWVNEYKYSFEIIEIALKKTISKTEATFKYIDAVISDWHQNGLRTIEEIEAYDAARKSAAKPAAGKEAKPRQASFKQRNYSKEYLNSLYDNLNRSKAD